MGKRKELEPWQKQDAARLKAIWDAKPRPSQQKFAEDFDLSSQPLVWQYLSGHIPLNLEAAIKFAQGLEVSVAEISPVLASVLDRLPESAQQVANDWLLIAEPLKSQWAHSLHLAAEQARKMGPVSPDARVSKTIQPAPDVAQKKVASKSKIKR